jgi:hypothetical protein
MPDPEATDRRRAGEDVVAWAVRSGRFGPARAAYWRDRIAADVAAGHGRAKQIRASAAAMDFPPELLEAEVGASTPAGHEIVSMAPLPWLHASAGSVDAGDPVLPDRLMFPPSPQQVDRHLEAVAAAENRRLIAASLPEVETLDEDFRLIYGDDDDD